jgi:delta 1-pyrroline-5-carboxylate dehydrogenase
MRQLEVTVYDGKYTIIQYVDGAMEVLRYGKPWTGTENVGPVIPNANVILALASELDDLRSILTPKDYDRHRRSAPAETYDEQQGLFV